MQHKDLKFTAKDRWDVEHEYQVKPSDPDSLIEIAVLLNSFAMEPLAEGLQALTRSKEKIMNLVSSYMRDEFKGMSADEILSHAVDSGLIEDILDNLDVSKITGAVRAGIMAQGMVSRLRPLFSMTFRDGKSLSKVTEYNAAYMRNYKELFEVAWRIMDYEGLIIFLDTASTSEAETAPSNTQKPNALPDNTTSVGGT